MVLQDINAIENSLYFHLSVSIDYQRFSYISIIKKLFIALATTRLSKNFDKDQIRRTNFSPMRSSITKLQRTFRQNKPLHFDAQQIESSSTVKYLCSRRFICAKYIAVIAQIIFFT